MEYYYSGYTHADTTISSRRMTRQDEVRWVEGRVTRSLLDNTLGKSRLHHHTVIDSINRQWWVQDSFYDITVLSIVWPCHKEQSHAVALWGFWELVNHHITEETKAYYYGVHGGRFLRFLACNIVDMSLTIANGNVSCWSCVSNVNVLPNMKWCMS